MLNIEVLGENGAWYKVNIVKIHCNTHFPHKFRAFYAVFKAHFSHRNFFLTRKNFEKTKVIFHCTIVLFHNFMLALVHRWPLMNEMQDKTS